MFETGFGIAVRIVLHICPTDGQRWKIVSESQVFIACYSFNLGYMGASD